MNDDAVRGEIEIMQGEFESHQLEVVLMPCKRFVNEGGCIRVAVSKNCDWYRRFCARHLSSRRRNHSLPDTKIKRRDVSRLLERLVAGQTPRSIYTDEILSIARARLQRPAAQRRIA